MRLTKYPPCSLSYWDKWDVVLSSHFVFSYSELQYKREQGGYLLLTKSYQELLYIMATITRLTILVVLLTKMLLLATLQYVKVDKKWMLGNDFYKKTVASSSFFLYRQLFLSLTIDLHIFLVFDVTLCTNKRQKNVSMK